eukprot:Skav226484  [mRNA]  locus=scaffold744:14189:19270:+ [translate_table: standard]
MIPGNWLEDELMSHEWSGSNTCWERGASYNLWVRDTKLVGMAGDDLVYRGVLSCPDGQMMTCCVKSRGEPHVCSKVITEAAGQLVEWRIPRRCVLDDYMHAFPCVALQQSLYAGIRMFTQHEADGCYDDGELLLATQDLLQCDSMQIEGKSDMSDSVPLPHRDDGVSPNCQASHDVVMSGGVAVTGCDEGDLKGIVVTSEADKGDCDASSMKPHLSTVVLPCANQGGVTPSTPMHDVCSESTRYTHEDDNSSKGKWGLGVLAPREVKILLFHLEEEVSQVYPKRKPFDDEVKWSLVELFAGGFAGWKQATQSMTKLNVPWVSTHAVEIQKDVAALYCKSFDVEHVFHEGDVGLRNLFPLHFESTLGDTMYCGDIQNPDWIKLVPWGNALVAAVSAPCPPWSRASTKDGLHHEDGKLMIATAVAMKFLQPLAITIENVDSMRDHRHFKCVKDVFAWAGYRMAWECVSELKKVAPISRKRWLAVFIRNQGEISCARISDFLEMPQPTLESHKVLMRLPEEHERDLTLTDDLLDVYSDVRYATKSMRMRFFREDGRLTSRDVLKMRVKHGRAVLATFVASYSAQHNLPEHRLREDGLFAELIDGKLGVRFVSPFEIASAHGLVHDLCLPKDIQVAHRVVGNGISVQHSILAWSHARNYVDIRTRCHPQEMVLLAMKDRLHADNSEFIDDERLRWLKRKTDELMAAQPDYDVGLPDDTLADTDLDSVSSEEVIPPTVPFVAECQIFCKFPDAIHVFTTKGDLSLRQLLTEHQLSYALNLHALNEDMKRVGPDEVLTTDMNLSFRQLQPYELDLVDRNASWKCFQPDTRPLQGVKNLASIFHLPELRGYDVTGNPIVEYDFNGVCRFVLLTTEILNFEHVWDFTLRRATSLKGTLADIRLILPICRVANDHIALAASVAKGSDPQRLMLEQVLDKMKPFLHACHWTWCQDEGKILGRFVPLNDCAAPVSAVHLPLLRCLLDGILSAFQGTPSIPLKLKLDGRVLWDKTLPADLQLDWLDAVLQCCLQVCGCAPVTWVYGGKRLLMDETKLGTLKPFSATLNLNMIGRCRGGAGAKTEAWKEIKNQLAKLMIQKGWSLVGLDEVTSDWVEKIGLSKLQQVFKTQLSLDRKWHTIMDYAKMRDLKVLPDDPVRMRAARTIQQAMRKSKVTVLVASRFRVAEGFFMAHNDQPLPVVQAINLKSTGICLMDWEAAVPWLSRELPITSDELAILTLIGNEVPDDFPACKELTFPALDDRQRPVVLRGRIWQLGEQHVKWEAHEKTIQQAPTIVVAVTVWRDEVSEALWNDISRSLVKTTLAMMEDIDSKNQILQVWGRSFRDSKTKIDPSMAHSAQFHCRVFADQIESILKTSGKNNVYLTPKSDNHLSHPGWSMLWFEDRVAVDIAANKATEHSGIARVKGKYALRVRAEIVTQVAKEIKCSDLAKDQLQIRQLYKIQPVPIGIKQEQLVEWARDLHWKIRIIKKLGKDAYLLGTDAPPPHPHLSLNGTVILIKQVSSHRDSKNASALVAGPKQNPVRDAKETRESLPELSSDPWGQFRLQNGTLMSSTNVSGAKGNAPMDQTMDGPIAQKFAAIEQRIQAQDQEMKQLTAECQKMAQTVTTTQSQVGTVDQKVTALEGSVNALQRDMQKSVEQAIGRGMASQDKKLDQKFEALMNMLQPSSTKRKELDEDEDQQMSPIKQL